MIDFFRTWLPQIIGYAEIIQDGTLQGAWAEGDLSRTSVYYSGELAEQVFGGLDADNMRWEMRQRLEQHPALVEQLELFLQSLDRLDVWIEAHVDTCTWGKGGAIPESVGAIFSSQEWKDARTDASAVVAVASNAGFSSDDFDAKS